jgi:thioredoxin 1
MKKLSIISATLFIMVLSSCNSIGGNNSESTSADIKEGVVNQMSTETFKKLVYNYQKNPNNWVYEGSQPCVIDFYADWCRPCKMVSPIMEELAKEYKGKVVFYRINTDQERELSQTFNISSIPAILYVPKNGKPQMSVGLASKEDYIQQIKTLLLQTTAIK